MEQAIGDLKQEMQEVLTENILSYWMRRMIDEEYGGFYGRVTGMDELTPEAVKGAILNARILWTFSAAYRLLDKEEYLTIARRAKSVIIDYFYDQEYEGVYWALDFKNQPLDTKKTNLCNCFCYLWFKRVQSCNGRSGSIGLCYSII